MSSSRKTSKILPPVFCPHLMGWMSGLERDELIMPCVPVNIHGTFLCFFWGSYEHSAPFTTSIKEASTGKLLW